LKGTKVVVVLEMVVLEEKGRVRLVVENQFVVVVV